MPARSEKQARLFRLVRGLQKGDISPRKVSPTVRKMARTIKPSSVKHFTKVKEIIQRLKENEYSLSKIKKITGTSFNKHVDKQVGLPFDEKEREIFRNKQKGFTGFGEVTFIFDNSQNKCSTEVSSNSTNKKFVFKKLIDNDDGSYKYACFVERTSLNPDKPKKEIIDLLSNSFDNDSTSEKTKTLVDFINRINTTLGSA